MRRVDMPAADAKKAREGKEGTPALSDKLVAELTAHRTMALRNGLANAPDVALIAVVHALAASVFYPYGGRSSCLHIAPHSAFLGGHAKKIAETAPAQEIEARQERWTKALPEDAANLGQFIAAMEAQERIALLAHCASLTIDAVRVPHPREKLPEAHIAQLTQAVQLDMAVSWKPTAANYFGRVSKERILEAVAEAVSKEAADNIKSLKKSAMADAAELRMAHSGWLPLILRGAANQNAAMAVAAE
jgi:ParB family chromosome partitioning protein